MANETARKILKKSAKIAAWIIGITFVVVLAAVLALQLPAVQLYLTGKATNYLEGKLKTRVELGGINVAFPKSVVLENIYLEDRKKDTLLYGKRLAVDIGMWALLDNEIAVGSIKINNLTGHVRRTLPDSSFNFDYILDAFSDSLSVAETDTSPTLWRISIDEIALRNIHLTLDDETAKSNLLLRLGELDLSFEELDVVRSVYKLDKVKLAHTTFSYISALEKNSIPAQAQTSPPPDTAAFPLQIGLRELSLDDVHITYRDQAAGQNLQADIGKSYLETDTLDITRQVAAINEFSLENSRISYQQAFRKKPAIPVSQPKDSAAPPPAWRARLDKLDLKENQLAYDDFNSAPQSAGMDFAHLLVSSLNAEANEIRYAGSDIRAKVKNLHFREKSGFTLEKAETNIALTETGMEAMPLNLKTGHSFLNGEVKMNFRSFAALAKEYADASLQIRILDSYLSARDLLYFQPDVLKGVPLRNQNSIFLKVQTSLRGQVKDLRIDKLTASTLNNTRLSVTGRVRNLPDVDKTAFQLDIKPFASSAADLRTLLQPSLLPSSIRLPAQMQLKAQLRGAVHDFNTRAKLETSLGNVLTDLRLQTNKSFSTGSYNGKLDIANVELGKLLKQEATLGRFSATASLRGSGFSPKEMRAEVKGKVQRLDYQQYTYRNATINATAKPNQFAGQVALSDTNLNFTLAGTADMRSATPRYTADLSLNQSSLKALNLAEKDIRAQVKIKADLRFKTLDNINGNVDIRKVAVVSEGKAYVVDSLLYVSLQKGDETDIRLNSDIMTGRFKGNINLAGIAGALERHFRRYYHDPMAGPPAKSAPQKFDFELQLRNTALLTDVLVPDLDTLRPGKINGSFDSEQARLNLQAELYQIVYAGTHVDTLQFNVESDARQLLASLNVAEVRQGSIRLGHTSLNAIVADDQVRTRFAIRDTADRRKYFLAGILQNVNREYVFRLSPDSVQLNYQPWKVPPDNAIRFGKKGFFLDNLLLASQAQRLSVGNVNGQPSSLQVGFENFQLATLGDMVSRDTSLVSGVLDGQARMFRQGRDTVFTSDLRIARLQYTGKPVGDITLMAGQRQAGRFDVRAALTGNGNDMAVDGFYLTKSAANALHFDVDINTLNLNAFAPFVKGFLKELSGAATGNMSIRGSTSKPQVDGEIAFRNTVFNTKFTNTPWRVDGQRIFFDRSGIHFPDFQMQDPANNTAVLSGDVLTNDFTSFELALNLVSDRFQLLNTTADDNNMYYGKVVMSSSVRITGNSSKPIVRANLKVDRGSEITYVVPQSDGTVGDSEGVVRFFDQDVENDPFIRRMQAATQKDTAKSELQGFEVSANIEVDSSAQVTAIIDPITGDQLKVKGETTLSLNINSAGDIDLTGRYQVQSGTYNLSFYNLVKREFALDKSSSITWSGNPYNAELDIRAVYQVVTSPMELVQSQLTGNADDSKYKQRLPFLVYLNIKGRLTKPEISFSLDMPPDKRNALGGNVYAKIQELNTSESEVNKQVFALFLLQRFIAENPLESSGGGFESSARSSVSKILSDQLNRLADQIKGVDLNFGVNSYQDYESSGGKGRTELELGLSKKLLNDRLVVNVTGNVNLEGSQSTSTTASSGNLSNFLGDLRLEYKLTDDGRLRLLGFRQRDFDVVSGELTETGVGVIFVRDYNAFRELFTRRVSE